jgi:hypothetical protein
MLTSDQITRSEVFRPRRNLRGCGSSLEQELPLDCAVNRGATRGRSARRGAAFALINALIALVLIGFSLAQTSAPSSSSGFGPAYDPAHEVTITGAVDQVVTQPAVGSPAGMHLLVASSQGVVDAHVGPFLSEQTKSVLQKGARVEMLGAMLSLHGKDYLLVRQLTAGGRTVVLRSPRGLLVHERVPGEERPARARRSQKPAPAEGGL